MLLVKHLAVRIVTWTYQIKEHFTDWQQIIGAQNVFVCDKCSSSDKTAEIMAIPFSRSATADFGCKKSIAIGFVVAYLKGFMCITGS
jgi:hypothetical protein